MKLFRPVAFLIVLLFALPAASLAQLAPAVLEGLVRDDNGNPFADVRVTVAGSDNILLTGSDGRYRIELSPSVTHTVSFASFGYETHKKRVTLKPGEHKTLDLRLRIQDIELRAFEKKDDSRKKEAGAVYIDPKKAQQIAGPIGGIEGIIKTLVGSTNELTSQYSVRGGNYDENLVYVNDFEIYRPFLVRSGQQEGLSFVNADLTQNVSFSVGGFQARYGDKMSSVLDVTYKTPKQFAGSVSGSLLGGSVHLEGASRNKKFTYLVGARQKSNQYLLKSQPTKGIYNPSFTDLQGLLHYRFNRKWETELIINYARNRFSYIPEEQTSSFGLANKAYQLRVLYTGSEIDQFDSRFGGYSVTFRPNENLKLKLLASAFQTNEQETYDISGEYVLGELETDLGKSNFGQTKYSLGTGVIQNYGRNYLKVNVYTAAHRGSYDAGNHFIQWGADFTRLDIRDELHSYQRRDSAGFTQPFSTTDLTMQNVYVSANTIQPFRVSGFLQDNFRFNDSSRYSGSFGVRYLYNSLNKEKILSPRLQLGYKPRWKKDWSFRFATGYYAQPAFYRELRDLQGNTNLDVQSQKSYHVLAGTETNFTANGSPFRFTTEVYYKKLWDLVPYEYDGIKIRYYGTNSSRGYAYGGEVRLYADLVKDATSWISLAVMKTEEQILQAYKGAGGQDSAYVYSQYVPRPTDQRVMVSMFFQDYLPQNHNFRVHLNMMYGTGLPFGYPNGNRLDDVLRMPAYKRVDIGFSALLLDGAKKGKRPSHSFFNNLESIWTSLEVFNLLNIQNTLSYTWIQDQTSNKIYAVPNRLTSRLLNLKVVVSF
ncbi:TonB-dependent receptor [Rurimicrobium arvi]